MSNNQFDLSIYIEHLPAFFQVQSVWHLPQQLADIIEQQLQGLGGEFVIQDKIAVHRTAVIEAHAIIKGPAIISANAFVAAHAYIRGGAFLERGVKIGPGVEIKSSVICHDTAIAHFNFVGDSIIGSNVNIEAGAILANHFNERTDKTISVRHNGEVVSLPTEKFGSIVGDHSRIGANAVLSPGTLLQKRSVVGRLELVAPVG